MASKLDKQLYGPGPLEIMLGAVLGLFLGVLLACVYLVAKPVKVVKEMPKEPEKGVVYYLDGSRDSAKARALPGKRQSFIAGSTVSLTEDELNAWVATWSSALPAAQPSAPAKSPAKPEAKPPAKPGEKPAQPAAATVASQGMLVPTAPTFRIRDGKLQIGVQCKINLAAYGFAKDLIVQAEGGFKKSGDHFVFAPDTVYLGSCPVHKLVAVVGPLVDKITGLYAPPDEIKGAWDKVKDVAVEGNTLKLTM